jgi:hypothetical protein
MTERELKTLLKKIETAAIELKQLREIQDISSPTGDKTIDYINSFSHYLNVIYIKMFSQVDYIFYGMKELNPKMFTTLRSLLESLASMIYNFKRFKSAVNNKDYEGAWDLLHKATLGVKTFPQDLIDEFGVTPPQITNVLTCIPVADKTLSEIGLFKDDHKTLEELYNIISESTHPNHQALALYWQPGDGKFQYNTEIRDTDFKAFLYSFNLLLVISITIFKEAMSFESKLAS